MNINEFNEKGGNQIAAKAAMPAYHIYWTNSCYWSSDNPWGHIQEALDYGKSKGFEFQVYEGPSDADPYHHSEQFRFVAYWTVFGGTNYL